MVGTTSTRNADPKTIEHFGREWTTFDQSRLDTSEAEHLFEGYFQLFPWMALPPRAIGFDLGCGSGRWARLVAHRVGWIHCIDASFAALSVARANLATQSNCSFSCASVDAIPLPDNSMDFGYSLGVLHHLPDTAAAVTDCVRKLKFGAPFLLYLYYAFDNRPPWYRRLWALTDIVRRFVSRSPWAIRFAVSQLLAAVVYYPAARSALMLERLGFTVDNLPLAGYRALSFYTMRTDALDRFGTRVELRFTRPAIQSLMESSGLTDVRFSGPPYWCAIGTRTR